jgi:hypothetical protein
LIATVTQGVALGWHAPALSAPETRREAWRVFPVDHKFVAIGKRDAFLFSFDTSTACYDT